MEDLLIAEIVPVLNERHPGLPSFSGTPVVESEVISDKDVKLPAPYTYVYQANNATEF